MTANTIFLLCMPGIPVTLLLVILIMIWIEKQRIKNLIKPGVQFIFYGERGDENPFTTAKTTEEILEVKFGFVKYKYIWEPTKSTDCVVPLDKVKSCSVKEFRDHIYSLKYRDVNLDKFYNKKK